MRNYNITPPEEKNFCVPSCLQAILRYEGINIGQKDIAKKLSEAEEGFKVHDEQIKQFLYELGFEYMPYWWNETPFHEPDLVLEEMNEHQGIIGIKNHAHIFYDYKPYKLGIIDPNDKSIKIKEYYPLIREMSETEGFFGLIKRL